MRHYTVENNKDAGRLDRFLTTKEPALARTFIQMLIKGGHVFVNTKKITRPAHGLKAGDALVVRMPSLKETGIQAEAIPLEVVYEDADMMVVNKPAGMVTHPTDHGAHVSGTLVNALLHHCKDLSGLNGEKRPGIVHRLDKDTSGLIMVAKSDAAHRFLARQIEARTVEKTYVTLVKGQLSAEEGSIEAPLLKQHGMKAMRVSPAQKAKYALTHYRVLEQIKRDQNGALSLLEVNLITGRTHQIRVHFAATGHPVAGDALYGDAALNERLREKAGLHRQFLHAQALSFCLPSTKKRVTLKAPLPQDLKSTLGLLGFKVRRSKKTI